MNEKRKAFELIQRATGFLKLTREEHVAIQDALELLTPDEKIIDKPVPSKKNI